MAGGSRPFLRALLAAVVVLAVLPATSFAASARVKTETPNDPQGPGVVTTLEYTAAAGETNNLSVSIAAGRVRLADAGAPIQAGSGCTQVAPAVVTCAIPNAGADVRLGDGPDGATVTLPATSNLTVRVDAGAGNDVVTYSGGLGQSASGGPGNDRLVGSDAADTLSPGSGTDTVLGRGGDDTIEEGDTAAGAGRDAFDGGAGQDRVSYEDRAQGVTVDLPADSGGGAGEGDVLASIEDAVGSQGDDRLIGDAAANELHDGLGGEDTISGGGGNDSAFSGSGGDTFNGGAGNDRFDAAAPGTAAFVLKGGPGNDRLTGGNGRDRISGGPGNDRVLGADGRDRIRGNSGRDKLGGGGGRDRVHGGSGRDRVNGNHGRDRVAGGSARDKILGGSGRDLLLARDGRRDRVNGGSGRDRAEVDPEDRVRRIEALL